MCSLLFVSLKSLCGHRILLIFGWGVFYFFFVNQAQVAVVGI